ncbi:MAG: hypothetical protein EOS85_32110 [Mesorhizobium sp.]|nr:MAG: hypothetical protein EOS85_32110 [Mesorhizobium sp.]
MRRLLKYGPHKASWFEIQPHIVQPAQGECRITDRRHPLSVAVKTGAGRHAPVHAKNVTFPTDAKLTREQLEQTV